MSTAATTPFHDTERHRSQARTDDRYDNVLVAIRERRATVTINRPEVYNCFNYLTLLELRDAFYDLGHDTGVDVVVVTGAGDKAFCTGADLKEQREVLIENPQAYYRWMGAFVDMHERLRNIGKPTIARLNGMAVGGGNEINMACDLAIAAEHAYIRHVGPAHGSVPAGGATQWLPIFVGDRRAREIIWLGKDIDAKTALDWGLVNQVVPAGELDAAVDDYVERLAHTLPETMRYTRTQTNFWKDFSWYQTIHHARDWLTLHTSAPEVREAVSGFVEKRAPRYGELREQYGTPAGAYIHGSPTRTCGNCAASGLPSEFSFCGSCGSEL